MNERCFESNLVAFLFGSGTLQFKMKTCESKVEICDFLRKYFIFGRKMSSAVLGQAARGLVMTSFMGVVNDIVASLLL